MATQMTLGSLGKVLVTPTVNSLELWKKYARTNIKALCYHSREANVGTVFFCLVGKSADGHNFAAAAYRAGCRFFVVEHAVDLPEDALRITVPNARAALADCAAAFYEHPEQKIRLVGLTGTKGKTTTALLIRSMLCAAGIPTGYIGTNGVDFADRHDDTVNSTPESLDIYRYLGLMVEAGMQVCVLEVSSQALWMQRIRGLVFDTTLFTNLSRDHIGGVEHPDMTHYRASKQKLFSEYPTRHTVVNADDAAAAYMLEGLPAEADTECLSFSVTDQGAEASDEVATGTNIPAPLWTASDIRPARQGGRVGVTFACRRGKRVFSEPWFLPLPGIFNVQNALAAITVVCECFDISPRVVKKCLAVASVAGRFETVVHPRLPDVTFIIDYAHNGVSLASILDALRIYEPTRLIALFGSVGGRTRERRRDLAEAAASRCDLCILTSDNPACEPPMEIIQEMDDAFPSDAPPRVCIPDRAEAIRYAVDRAEAGDIILLAGKGHERYQLIGTQRVPFSERLLLEEALEARTSVGAPM